MKKFNDFINRNSYIFSIFLIICTVLYSATNIGVYLTLVIFGNIYIIHKKIKNLSKKICNIEKICLRETENQQ